MKEYKYIEFHPGFVNPNKFNDEKARRISSSVELKELGRELSDFLDKGKNLNYAGYLIMKVDGFYILIDENKKRHVKRHKNKLSEDKYIIDKYESIDGLLETIRLWFGLGIKTEIVVKDDWDKGNELGKKEYSGIPTIFPSK